MPTKMNWKSLLCDERYGDYSNKNDDVRLPYERDYDRIIFSSAFRRLQDKTQVFPIPQSDFVHNRLTHSLETATIGRSLGKIVGKRINTDFPNEKLDNNDPHRFSIIVSTACLAHDIGNPPFGHSGEKAISEYFIYGNGKEKISHLSRKEKSDFTSYEGNASGFRILTRDHQTGLKLTYATLAAFSKYPRGSSTNVAAINKGRKSHSKHGYFSSELSVFIELASKTGLVQIGNDHDPSWCRHPLSFLVEASDTIAYTIIDLEDGIKLKYVPLEFAKEKLFSLMTPEEIDKAKKLDLDDSIAYSRAKSINKLIHECADVFIENYEQIMTGHFDHELTDVIKSKLEFNEIVKLDRKMYSERPVMEIELAGFEVLGGLLDIFLTATKDYDFKKNKFKSKHSEKLVSLIPNQFLGHDRIPDNDDYTRILKITDYICRMTDSYAISLYRKLKGISLPDIGG